ncbi:hypothetical protein [Microbulbifer sp. A4B17]|uniref:hypothetical protein n=1 Tax=Microbulbifer sp. A4B17 TaxID=359370 RepID=UPI001300A0C4|nr:hypothetical protein [Microbulbifer sp. A4B17]
MAPAPQCGGRLAALWRRVLVVSFAPLLIAGPLLLAAPATNATDGHARHGMAVEFDHVSPYDPQRLRTLGLGAHSDWPHLVQYLLDAICSSCPAGMLCCGFTAPPVMVLDVGNLTAHPFVGIGTNMAAENSQPPDNEVGTLVNLELATPLVRTVVGPDWNQVPHAPPVTPAGQTPDEKAFYDYIAQYFPLQINGQPAPWHLRNAQDTINTNHARGASIVLSFFNIPSVYRDNTGLVNIKDFAAFWIALLQYLHDNGVDMPKYIELANEPNVTPVQNPNQFDYIAPQDYGTLVIAVADSLASMASDPNYSALAGIGIIGPGVNVMEAATQANGTIQWVQDMSAAAVSRLAGWSAHAYNDNDAGVFTKWQSFIDTARGRADLPFFVTEFATVGLDFPGAPLPAGCTSLISPLNHNDQCASSNSTGFGVRVVENLLALANLGVSGGLYWIADDKDGSAWGLAAGRFIGSAPRRPAFYALQSLSAPLTSTAGGCTVDTTGVQSGWTALAPSWDPTLRVPGAGFVNPTAGAVVVSLVNPTATAVSQAVQIQGGTIANGSYSGCTYSTNGIATASVSMLSNAFIYTLPPNSTLTVRFPMPGALAESGSAGR